MSPQAAAMANPHRIDFHQRDVPSPIDVRGNRSPRRMINNRVIALSQSSVSFQIAAARVRVGQKYDTDCRTSNIANSDRKRPRQVAVEIFTGAAVFLLTMVSLMMRQEGNLDSRIFDANLTSD
jgi:predicted nucleic acid-binding Zn ribbon protein